MTGVYPVDTETDVDPATDAPKRSALETESMLQKMIRAGTGHQKDANEKFRIDATKYYKGEKFGNEKPGQSDVVVTDVRDTVQQLMAPLLSILYGPISAVEFRPRNAQEIDEAQQQTGYINYIFRDENSGFLILHGALKDALVRRMGIIKYWWEEKKEIESQTLSGLDEAGVEAALMDGGEVVDMEQSEDGTLKVTIQRERDYGCIRVAGVPTERVFYNKDAQSRDGATIIGHWEDRTIGDLIALGYDPSELRDVATAPIADAETQARRPDANLGPDDTMVDENRPVRYYEAYVKLSSEPGKPTQLMRACFAGEEAMKLLSLEPADEFPFALFVPDPEPHSIEGLGVADGTMDLQRINSDVARGVLNSLQLAITPRTAFVPGAVNVKDLLNTEINALIRTRDINAIRSVEHRFLGEAGIGVLEFFRGMKEDRFGTSRAAAGLNPDALQSSTKSAVAATVSASQQRVLMLAQIFAETGMKQLFAGLYRLAKRHQKKELVFKLRGNYVAVNPASWSDNPTLIVNVGVGAGTVEDRINSLMAIIAKQEQYITQGLPLADIFLLRNSLAELALLTGRVDPNRYWSSPEAIAQAEQAKAQQPPPPPDPEIVIAEAQVETERAKLTLAEQKQQFDLALAQQKMNLEREQMLLQDDRERDKIEADLFVKIAEIEAKTGVAIDTAKIKADMARTRTDNPGA